MASSLATLARKVLTLSARDWADLVRAQWELLAARGMVRNRPIGSLATPAANAKQPIPRVAEAKQPRRRRSRGAIRRLQASVPGSVGCALPHAGARGIGGGMVRGACGGAMASSAHAGRARRETLDADDHVGSFVPLTNLDLRP